MPDRAAANVTPAATEVRYAAGARVEIRDEEWMVRSVQGTATGGHALRVVGVSDLVRGRESMFLDDLDQVTVLDPRETALVGDDSPQYRRTRLYLESLLRQSPPTSAALTIGHRGAMNVNQYQLVPAAKALAQPRARILIADGVGLGKTLEVGVLLAELIRRGRGRRILVVALRSVLEQFQGELWARFTIPLVRLDSRGIQRVQQQIPANMNPFHFYERVIISIDTLKRDTKYRRFLDDCRWDAIVIDECQHVAERSTQKGQASMRAQLAQRLARTCDALILTSATPHDGRPESFASLMNLLDPTAVTNPSEFTNEEIGGLYVRRFKKDIEHEVSESFQDRQLVPHHVSATPAEEALLAALATAEFKTIGRLSKAGEFAGSGALFRTLLKKSALSSADALLSTLSERSKHPRLSKPDKGAGSPEAAHDRALIGQLSKLARSAQAGEDTQQLPSKLARLIELLRSFGDDRVVVFSERIHTLDMLERVLGRELGLDDGAIRLFSGSLDDTSQQQTVKDFGSRDSKIRVLLCSDAAAEGINLHFYCHRLVHYDIPWSLITLEQRNGRIDRYGQTEQPQIHYLLTRAASEGIDADMQVLDRLVQKEHEAHKNLGDVQSLLHLQDAASEEQHVLEGVAAGHSPEQIIPEVPDPATTESFSGLDFLAELAATQAQSEREAQELELAPSISLYPDDLSFTLDAFGELASAYDDIQPATAHVEASGLEIVAPPDLARRFELLPPELQRDGDGRFKLTTDREFLMREFQRARERSHDWPAWDLLWPLNPISEWLCDRLVAHMTRHAAPVIGVDQGLEPGQVCFMVHAVVSNQRSQPTISQWFGLCFTSAEQPPTVIEAAQLIAQLGLDRPLANDGRARDTAPLLGLRELAVDAAKAHMAAVRSARAKQLKPKIRAEIRRLDSWADARLDQLDDRIAAEKRAVRAAQLEQEKARVERLQHERKQWFQEALATDAEPYLRIAAVFVKGS
ncbi:helicase-related protein [Enhygromyxa salina]|uniref:RNA polymerase-associated protein RapA n=1 Tax=Enhygromyxa salina TaxID=215803 RepID=A0A2S9XQW4_9BACT|nr:helicase-related protein [Enhygromyxa salina]PRP95254.1 RNA polymerase-associated protein RapA [Enhygromyxa salina]